MVFLILKLVSNASDCDLGIWHNPFPNPPSASGVHLAGDDEYSVGGEFISVNTSRYRLSFFNGVAHISGAPRYYSISRKQISFEFPLGLFCPCEGVFAVSQHERSLRVSVALFGSSARDCFR